MEYKKLKISDFNLKSPVLGVTSDTRAIRPGMIFVAVRGVSQDGHQYLKEAEQRGAVALVGEISPSQSAVQVPYLQVSNSALALADLAVDFYGNPSKDLLVLGVTGTSGKTTTTYLLEAILRAAGYHVGLMGTVSVRYGSTEIPATHTTPGAVEVQSLLATMKSSGCNAVVMEVSSHALKQGRVHGVAFDGMVFSNLSPEHLDYHSDMEDYFLAKSILFTDLAVESILQGKKPVAAIHAADPYGRRLIEILKSRGSAQAPRVIAFSDDDQLQCGVDGIAGNYHGIEIRSVLVGKFNVSNLIAAASLCQGLGIGAEKIARGVAQLSGVPGRLERVPNSKGVHIWVDYAHKPDALEKVLRTLREMRGQNRLITVFGCGGDRDRKKRPLMGQIAVQWSDQVWVTSDNPRTEDPHVIIQEIVKGIGTAKNFSIQVDRKKAIFEAIASARPGDLVLIAGKGHEDYQILGTQKIHFDDREVASEAIRC